MPIYKDKGKKDGLQKYRVRVAYTDKNGQYKQKERVAYGFDAAKEAEMALQRELKGGVNIETKLTVKELYDEFIAIKEHETRESSVTNVKKHFKRHILPYFENTYINKITPKQLQQWKQTINEFTSPTGRNRGNSLAIVSKKNIYTSFNALFKYAVKMEYIHKNPFEQVGNFKDSYLTTAAHEMDYYTPEEFNEYISVAKAQAENKNDWRYYVFFNIAFYTGLRKGEINALKWSDIFDNTIHVRRSISQKMTGEDRETAPKNKSSIRDVQMPLPLVEVINEHKTRCQQLDGFSEDWRVCGGTKCLRDSTIDHRNTKYAELAGLKHIRIHDFRHSHASVLANNGINIQEIARRLGHSKVEITWNTYSHLYPKEEERALQVLNSIPNTPKKSLNN